MSVLLVQSFLDILAGVLDISIFILRKNLTIFITLFCCFGNILCYKQMQYDLQAATFTRGQKLTEGVFRTEENIGISKCIRYCYMHFDCQLISYNRQTFFCEMGRNRNMSGPASAEWYITEPRHHPEIIYSSCNPNLCSGGEVCINMTVGGIKCLKANCESPPKIPRAVVSNNISTIGSSVRYSCRTSLSQIAQTVLTCLSSGEWTLGTLVCDGIDVFSEYYRQLSDSSTNDMTTRRYATYTTSVSIEHTAKSSISTAHFINPSTITTKQTISTRNLKRQSTSTLPTVKSTQNINRESTVTTKFTAWATLLNLDSTVSSAASPFSCSSPFQYSRSQEHYFCYAHFTEHLSNSDAIRNCKEHDGHLFMAISQDKLEQLYRELRNSNSNGPLTVLIDGNDFAQEGTFLYHNGQTVDLDLFERNKPDGGTSKNCLRMQNKKIVDVSCETEGEYVCEKTNM